MYDDLYEVWKREKEDAELQALPKDFYAKLAQYVKKIKEEGRMLDEKTTKARLLMRESKNVQRMLEQLLMLRHEKIVNKMSNGGIPSDHSTSEEEKLVKEMSPSFESFQTLLKDLLSGRLPDVQTIWEPKKRVLRFLKEIPAIIGADMKTYGPFKPEDVASLPLENARILTKQGIAVEVEVKGNNR